MGPENATTVTEFMLEGFPELDPRLQLFFSRILLLMYLTTVMGNATIIFLLCVDHHLKTSMDFFICSLAFMEMWFTFPTSIQVFVLLSSGQNTLSLSSCFAKNYFCLALGCTEFFLLVVMSFHCYVAICHPLLYAAIRKPQLCVHLGVAAWVLGFALLSYRLLFLSELSFCGSKIPHFLCDNSPLFKLSCSDTSLLWKIDSVFLPCVQVGSLCLTLAFDICILFCVLHLPAASGRKEALTTCSSHPIPFSIACGSCVALYTCPAEDVSLRTNRTRALLNTALYPFLNPFIYSLGNKSVMLALNKSIPRPRTRTKLFP